MRSLSTARPASLVPCLTPLVVRGAREHNLKNIAIELPRDKLIVFTGLSGSGKSSLAFDTIYAEGQRRYVESLSSYARQFLGQMDKPDVDFIEGLSPAISIDQKSASPQPALHGRHDHRGLRLPPAALRPHRRAALPGVRRADHPPDAAADRRPHPRAARGHPLPGARAGGARPQGHLRDAARRPGRPGLRPGPDRRRGPRAHRQGRPGPLRAAHHRGRRRPARACATASSAGSPTRSRPRCAWPTAWPRCSSSGATARRSAAPRTARPTTRSPSRQHLACPNGHGSFEELAPRNFSFNSPYGACETCDGLGTRFEVDPELIVPNPDLSLAEGAISPWASASSQYFKRLVEAVAEELGADIDRPVGEAHQEAAAGVPPRHRRRQGAGPLQEPLRPGALLHRQLRGRRPVPPAPPLASPRATTPASRSRATCARCRARPARAPGSRPLPLAVTIDGHSIADICDMSIGEAAKALAGLELSERDRMIAERVVKEVNARMGFLLDVGLDYLIAVPLGRHARRRRGPAHPAGLADRLRAGRACSTCSTSRRSGSTSATTTG